MASDTKLSKIARVGGGPTPFPPLPQVPKLPEFLKARFPDKSEEIDQYNQQWIDFFKKAGVIANT